MRDPLFPSNWLSSILVVLLLAATPADLFAIHAVLKNGEPIPREHGPLSLGMALPRFLQLTKGVEEPPAIGQFKHERRFVIDASHFGSDVKNVVCDFYKGTLFRIEINHRPSQKNAAIVEDLKEKWSHRFGPPRINTFPGTHLLFWDDGKTRLILAEDEEEKSVIYSTTYIDDDLFHEASHERVRLETDGQSSYGK
jgi:hypothetical protein